MSLEQDLAKFLAIDEQRKTRFGNLPEPIIENLEDEDDKKQIPVQESLYGTATNEYVDPNLEFFRLSYATKQGLIKQAKFRYCPFCGGGFC